MTKTRFVFLASMIFMSAVVSTRLQAQDTAPSETKVGISASVQNSQLDILVPILFDETSIAPAIGINWQQDGATDLRIGLVPRFFFHRDKFSPYMGFRVALLIYDTPDNPSTFDGLVGIEGGGEYFLDDHFSFGVEGQFNATVSDTQSSRFGNPGKVTMNTGAAVFATVYF